MGSGSLDTLRRSEVTRRNLKVFLVLVVLLQFGFPITEHGTVWAALYMPLWAGTLFVGVLVARSEQQPVWPYVLLGVLFSVSGIGVALDATNTVALMGLYGTGSLFVGGLLIALLRVIYEKRTARGEDLILAAVGTYLLLGGLFAGLHGVVVTLDGDALIDTVRPDGPVTWQQILYYSYVTMATLGYGEILPVSSWARALAILETVTGTLFMATVIARLVGVYSSWKPAVSDPSPAPDREHDPT